MKIRRQNRRPPPPVGKVRIHDGPHPTIYPGERAVGTVCARDLQDIRPDGTLPITSWTIEPDPGVRAFCWRLFYRTIGYRIEHVGLFKSKQVTTIMRDRGDDL